MYSYVTGHTGSKIGNLTLIVVEIYIACKAQGNWCHFDIKCVFDCKIKALADLSLIFATMTVLYEGLASWKQLSVDYLIQEHHAPHR